MKDWKHYKKKINKRIKMWEDELDDNLDEINVQTREKPLNAKQIIGIAKAIEWQLSNPHRNLFEEEELFLDDTNGLISIIEYSYSDIDSETAKEIYEYLKSNFKEDMDKILVFIGSHTFGLK